MTDSTLADFVRRNDPDRFLASLFAPTEQRQAVWVLCAVNHELARAREVVSEPMLALIRLQWWREVVQGVRRRHEVAGPLGALLDRGVVAAADVESMIAAREVEADETMPDVATWRAHKLGTGGGLAVAVGRLLGGSAAELERLRLLGGAYAAVGSVLGVAGLARQGRCGLPDALLGVHGLTRDHVLRDPSCATPVLAELTGLALEWLRGGAGGFSGRVIAAALPAVLARRDLVRGGRHRGVVDRLAVVRAGLLGRI